MGQVSDEAPLSRPRRFCLATTFFPPYNFGGDGIFVYRLANALARRGHSVHVVHDVEAYYLFAREPAAGDYPLHPNVAVHPLHKGRGGAADLLLSHQLGRPVGKRAHLATLLNDGRFDVIHFHNISLLGGAGVLRYGSGVKLCTTHDHWFVCPMHVLWRFNREPCARRTCLACTLHGCRPPQLWRYQDGLRRLLAQVDAFIAPSRFARDSHYRNGFPVEMQVIPYFMPEAEPAAGPAAGADLHDRPYFLFVGRLEKMKGLQEVITAFAGYDKADLLIAGKGSHEASLRAQAAGLPHVRFLGHQEQDRLRRLYQQAVAVIVPSLCYETFGWPVLEAFVSRTPAIVHDLGALPEVASTGGVSYRSAAGLLEAMERLRTQQGLRNELGEAGFRLYQQHYTEPRHLEQYFGLIARIEAEREAAQGPGRSG